ncbi:MAG: hypothetical protein NTY07_00870 [Bacteroidia bacterium]|nr:hypothetical protein [Bacteroidia bacterium]
MKKVKVLLDFIRLSIPLKIIKGRNIEAGLTGNARFSTPDVTIPALKAATDALEDSYVLAQNRNPEDTATMHQNEKAWDKLMRKEALYVDRIADGDEAAILSTGFNISRQPTPALRPEFSVQAGEMRGSVLLKRKAYPGARAYLWQYCVGVLPENDSDWIYAGASGMSSFVIQGLNSVTKYWFRVAPIMAQGTSAFCDPIMFTVA